MVQRLAVRPKQTELDKAIEALLLSFLLYLIASPFFGFSFPLRWQKKTTLGFDEYAFQLNWAYLAVLAGLAVTVGILYGASLNHDWPLRLLRKANVTQRTARNSIWNYALQDIPSSYVLVQLAGDRSVIGYLRYYSDEPEDASLFLEDAAWIVDKEGTQSPIDGPGILITKQAGIETVSFLRTGEDEFSQR
ncbi:MAG TPA: DUF6338 family protein [Terracidiphilus sp.]|nr:DUF6338 family protein [Terracidiphilus sp.]